MKTCSARVPLCILVALLLAAPVFGAEVMPLVTAGPDVDARVAKTAATYEWVRSFESADAAAYDVQVPAERLRALKADVPSGGPLWLGVDAAVDFTFRPGLKRQPIGSMVYHGDFVVWTGTFRSAGASAVRLRLDNVDLPAGAELFVFGEHGHVYGPYTNGDVHDASGVLWTNTVAGDVDRPSSCIAADRHDPRRPRTASLFTRLANSPTSGIATSSATVSRPRPSARGTTAASVNAECASIPGAVQPVQDAVAYLHLQPSVAAATSAPAACSTTPRAPARPTS